MTPTSEGVKVTLYWLEESRAHRILWLLEELNIPYELKTFKRGADKLAPKALRDIHLLGKSPIVTIQTPDSKSPLVLAESGFIVEYLCGHFGGEHLIPRQFKDGMQERVAGETEEWLRYRYYMHYTEGSLMPNLVIKTVMNVLRTEPPLFIRGLFKFVASKIEENFLDRNFEDHFDFLENQLRSAPGGGPFLAGQHLSATDIMMSYPAIESVTRVMGVQKGITVERYPLLRAYAERLQECPGYNKAVGKIVEIEGRFSAC